MSGESPASIRQEIIETREKLAAADSMETRVENLRHDLADLVEAQRRSVPDSWEQRALKEAYDPFINPAHERGQLFERIDQMILEFSGSDDTSRMRSEIEAFLEEAFPYLRGTYVDDDGARRTAFEVFRRNHTVEDDNLQTFVDGLEEFVDGDAFRESHRTEIETAFQGAVESSQPTPDRLLTFFEYAVEAVRTYRGDLRAKLNTTVDDEGEEQPGLIDRFLQAADGESTDPASFLKAKPVALLPVRVETRFVSEEIPLLNEPPDRDPHLRLRVFPDEIHVDTHEEELTTEEERLGRFFWAKLWICSHPDPAAAMGEGQGADRTHLVEREETRNHLKAVIDTDEFDSNPKLYQEVKKRSWRQLVDRLGRERAAWVVHRMAPTEIADNLLAGWTPDGAATDGGAGEEEISAPPWENFEISGEKFGSGFADFGKRGPFGTGGPELGYRASVETAVIDFEGSNWTPPFEEGDSDDPNGNVPELSFQPVDNRPESWTKQPRAKLMPDRWVVYGWTERSEPETTGEGEDEGDGEIDLRVPDWARERIEGSADLQFDATVAEELLSEHEIDISPDDPFPDGGSGSGPDLVTKGRAIREPLPMGPDPKRDGDHTEPPTDSTAAQAPEGMRWTVDFEEAERAGMALRIDEDDLRVSLADDEDITDVNFERLVVLGVKSTMAPEQSTTGLRALFEAHHYTDGLEFLESGTPTNNTDEDSGYTAKDDPADSLPVECGQPLSGFGDDAEPDLDTEVPTDGDLLARTLGIASPDEAPHEHVFAHVGNADRIDVAAQHHANAALWDGTIGYYLRNVLLSNRWTGDGSIWDDSGSRGPYTGPTELGPFFENPTDVLGKSMVREDELRRHFVRYVRAEGPLPTIRAGRQPYGILPVTDVDQVESDHVVDLVQTLRGPFERAASDLRNVNDARLEDGDIQQLIRQILQRTANGNAYIPDAFKKTGSGRQQWRRTLANVLSRQDLLSLDRGEPSLDPHLGWLQPTDAGGSRSSRNRTDENGPSLAAESSELVGHTDNRFLSLLTDVSFDDLRRMGYEPRFDELVVEPGEIPSELTPDNPDLGFNDQELLFYALTRASGEQWEDLALHDAIRWSDSQNSVRDAIAEDVASPEVYIYYLLFDLYDEYGDPGTLHTLLRALSRFSLLDSYVGDRIRATLVTENVPSLNPSTVSNVPVPDPGTESGQTVWEWLESTSPANTPWVSYVEADDDYRSHDVKESLSVLSRLEPAALQRLLTGTLSLASHRFDAWWTSIATRRLVENRQIGTDLREGGALSSFARHVTEYESEAISDDVSYTVSKTGGEGQAATRAYDGATVTYVGGYGLVEDLNADIGDDGESNGSEELTEFTQAPTIRHATTAALLRGAHKHLDEEDQLAVDFSADRIRKGRAVLQGLKHGQRLGALLGYRFERYVKENGSGPEIGYIAEYRKAFPAIAGTLDHGDGPKDDDAEFDVTDGYQLYHAWRRAENEDAFFTEHGLTGTRTQTLLEAIEEVETTVGAIRDLLLAEDLHQLGMGNFERAGWSVDGLASGEGIPKLDVLETPRDGIDVSHRAMTLFGEPGAASPPTSWQVSGRTLDPDSLPSPPGEEPEPEAVSRVVSTVENLPSDPGPGPTGEGANPRRDAEANLNAWVGEFLPDPKNVGCSAAFQWTGERAFSTGSFTTPTEETTVSVRDVGFEPDLLVFVASTAVEKPQSKTDGDGAVGWYHGAAARTGDNIDESAASVTVTPEGTTASASTNDRAISIVRQDDAGATERTIATVRRTVDDGFDLAFSTVESSSPVVIEYLAIQTGAVGSVDVGHIRTQGATETDTYEEQLSVNADHAMVATGAAGAPGFSHGHAISTDSGTDEVSLGVGATPDGDSAVGARADRSVHLPYGPGEATSATVTELGSTLELKFSAPAGTSFRDDGAVCTYVAFETPTDVAGPAVGFLEEGHNNLGFEPGAVSLVGVPGIAREDLSTSNGRPAGGVTTAGSGAVGFSHGVALGPGNQRSLHHAVQPDSRRHSAIAGAGNAVTFISTDVEGEGSGRTTCKITGTDEQGFTASFQEGLADDGLVIFTAWPADPETLAHEEPTSTTIADLNLTPIDLLYHGQQHSEAGESQLEQRIAYELFRTRGQLDPEFPIPDDAAVNLEFAETPASVTVSVAELLEVLRSVRELTMDSRSIDADDLIHPAEAQGTGYTAPDSGATTTTVGDLRQRALTGTKTLQSVRSTIENRRAALTAPDEEPTLTEQMSDLRVAVEAFDAEVPTAAIERATADIDADDVTDAMTDPAVTTLGAHLPGSRTIDADAVDDVGDLLLWELETVGRFLPAGPTEEPEGANGTTLKALTDRTVAGTAEVNGRVKIDLHIWSGSPGSAFTERTISDVETDKGSSFETSVDFSEATPGEHITVVGTFSEDLSESGEESESEESDGSGIVRLSSILDREEYRSYDWEDRVEAVRRIDMESTNTQAILDEKAVTDGDTVTAYRIVISDPEATIHPGEVAVVVESGEADQRVAVGFHVGDIESRDLDDASEWFVRPSDLFTTPRGPIGDENVFIDDDVVDISTEELSEERSSDDSSSEPGLETREILRRTVERLNIEDPTGVVDPDWIPEILQEGDLVYAATARVVEPDAQLTAEVDPDTAEPPTATIERRTDLDQGTSLTIEAARPNGTVINSTTATVNSDGHVSTDLPLDGLGPRTAFSVSGTADGDSIFELSGCTVSPDDSRRPTDVLSKLTVLPRLLWLDGVLDPTNPSRDGTPGARLRAAVTAVDWDRVDSELGLMEDFKSALDADSDADNPALTDRVIEAVKAVSSPEDDEKKALEMFDPLVMHSNLDRLIEPLDAMAVTDSFSVVGTPTDRSSLGYWETPDADLGRVQGALEHAIENPAILLGEREGIDYSFAPQFKAYVEDNGNLSEDAAQSFSHYLGELLAYPDWFVRNLESSVDAPHKFLRHLGALVYEPETFVADATPSKFKTQFGKFADSIQGIDRLEELLTPSPTFPDLSEELGVPTITASLDGSSVSLPSAAVAEVDQEELELVVENITGATRTVEVSVGGDASDRIVPTGDTRFTLPAGGTRRLELALVRPDEGAATATVEVTDVDASVSATVDVSIHSFPSLEDTNRDRDPVSELYVLCLLFDHHDLDGYMSSISASSGGLPSGLAARTEYADNYDRWVTRAADAADGARARVETALDAGSAVEVDTDAPDPLATGAFDDALRIGMLEPLRRALLRGSYLGIYGSTPQSPAGGSPADVTDLVNQAEAVIERIDDRFSEVDTALGDVDSNALIDETVRALSTAVEAVFDDAFTVYPVFEPHNAAELSSTFANESLVPDDCPLAAESFLSRMARFRDRPEALREAYAYGEVMTGRPLLDLTLGQLPHRPDDDWIGLSDVSLSTNRQSIIAQLETGAATNGVASGPVAGLFIDDWNETIPERTQTAGVAVNYDAPDATAGNAIFLATPPKDSGWSWTAEDIRTMVTDAAEMMKIRMVDLEGARGELDELLPAVWLPDSDEPEPTAPSVDLSLLEYDGWETYRQDASILALLEQLRVGTLPNLTDLNYELATQTAYARTVPRTWNENWGETDDQQ